MAVDPMPFTEMDSSTRELFEAARVVRENAHCPYSEYPVGAAVRTLSGNTYTGCNVENAAYPLGNCAETSALAAMVAAGERSAVEVVVVTSGPTPGTPCGGCRQRIREFATPATRVHAATADGSFVTMTVDQMLPLSFGPDDLKAE